jgi:hypothetical protein
VRVAFEQADRAGAWFRVNGLLTYVSWSWVEKEAQNTDLNVKQAAKSALLQRKKAS